MTPAPAPNADSPKRRQRTATGVRLLPSTGTPLGGLVLGLAILITFGRVLGRPVMGRAPGRTPAGGRRAVVERRS
jgi:hypothetical protein